MYNAHIEKSRNEDKTIRDARSDYLDRQSVVGCLSYFHLIYNTQDKVSLTMTPKVFFLQCTETFERIMFIAHLKPLQPKTAIIDDLCKPLNTLKPAPSA